MNDDNFCEHDKTRAFVRTQGKPNTSVLCSHSPKKCRTRRRSRQWQPPRRGSELGQRPPSCEEKGSAQCVSRRRAGGDRHRLEGGSDAQQETWCHLGRGKSLGEEARSRELHQRGFVGGVGVAAEGGTRPSTHDDSCPIQAEVLSHDVRRSTRAAASCH
jgi:hypothetical protein